MAEDNVVGLPAATQPEYPWAKNGDHPRSAFSEVFSYRPNKFSQTAYWHLRDWCEKNGMNMCDLFNSILPALAYYCLNYTEKEPDVNNPDKIRAYVHMQFGRMPIRQFQNRTVHKNFQADVKTERLLPE